MATLGFARARLGRLHTNVRPRPAFISILYATIRSSNWHVHLVDTTIMDRGIHYTVHRKRRRQLQISRARASHLPPIVVVLCSPSEPNRDTSQTNCGDGGDVPNGVAATASGRGSVSSIDRFGPDTVDTRAVGAGTTLAAMRPGCSDWA